MMDYASCSNCIHDQECAEVEGRQEGKRWGAECDYPDSDPKFELDPFYAEENLKRLRRSIAQMEESGGTIREVPPLTPGSPEECPENGPGCDECDYYMECYPNWKEQG